MSNIQQSPAGHHRLRILIADDSIDLRNKVKKVVGDLPGAIVVGEATSPREVIEGTRTKNPDMVILNVQMKGYRRENVLEQIHGVETSTSPFVLANFPSLASRTTCRNAGLDFFFERSLERGTVNEIMKILVQPGHSSPSPS